MKTKRQCPVCGALYQAEVNRLKHGRQTTCSRACSYRFRAAKLENKITLICAVCGKNFSRPLSHIKAKHGAHFCSPSCQYQARGLGITPRVVNQPYKITEEGRRRIREGAKKTREKRIQRDNYRHTKETIAKLRHATSRAIAEGRVPARSQIEKKVSAFLDSAGVEFVYQHPVRDSRGRYVAVFDFFIPKDRAIIEVNGTFWHADPRFYPEGPLYPSQQRVAACWARKLQVISNRGYQLHIVWEHDLKKSGTEYLSRVLETIT